LAPISVDRLRALTKLDLSQHHFIFERQRTSVNLADFANSFQLSGEFQNIAKYLSGDKTVSYLTLFDSLRIEFVYPSELNLRM
jgi:hypothetical protein